VKDLTSFHYYRLITACGRSPVAWTYRRLYLNSRLAILNGRSRSYRDALLGLLASEKILTLDMAPVFLKAGVEKAFLYDRRDSIHPSPLGHELIAEELAKILAR
jgi:lysophospholipase L1-like esterase